MSGPSRNADAAVRVLLTSRPHRDGHRSTSPRAAPLVRALLRLSPHGRGVPGVGSSDANPQIRYASRSRLLGNHRLRSPESMASPTRHNRLQSCGDRASAGWNTTTFDGAPAENATAPSGVTQDRRCPDANGRHELPPKPPRDACTRTTSPAPALATPCSPPSTEPRRPAAESGGPCVGRRSPRPEAWQCGGAGSAVGTVEARRGYALGLAPYTHERRQEDQQFPARRAHAHVSASHTLWRTSGSVEHDRAVSWCACPDRVSSSRTVSYADSREPAFHVKRPWRRSDGCDATTTREVRQAMTTTGPVRQPPTRE
jgi:hypothetical protein